MQAAANEIGGWQVVVDTANELLKDDNIKIVVQKINTSNWDEYYQKLVFFHQEYVMARNEYEEQENKRIDGMTKLQAQGSQRPRPRPRPRPRQPQKKRK